MGVPYKGIDMLNGYCIVAKDYKAEIVEFATLSIINTPDGGKIYLIHTKYGDDYRKESELSPTREKFEKECEEINKSFDRIKRDKSGKSIYHKR